MYAAVGMRRGLIIKVKGIAIAGCDAMHDIVCYRY